MPRKGRSSPESAAFAELADACAAVALHGTCDARRATPPRPHTPIALVATDGFGLAKRHRVGPLAFGELARRMRDDDPVVAKDMRGHACALRLKALRHAALLVTLTTALDAGDVRHLAIKGVVLAQQIYGDGAARNSKDVDLLVDPASIERAVAILRCVGCVETEPSLGADTRFANKHRTFACDGVEIELHTRLIDIERLVPLPFDALWDRRARVAVGAVPVATLSDADTFLYLCAHGAAHLWFRLKWLEDIARIVAIADPAPITAARAVARTAGAEAIVLAALALVDAVFDIALPGPPVPTTRASRALVRLSLRALAAPADHASRPPFGAILRKVRVQFALSTDWRYRARLAQALILAPRAFDVRSLPPGLDWLRLPLRPVMLLRHRRRGG